MIQDFVRGKNVLLAFSDPAGAKQVLSYAAKYRDLFKSVVAVSDRTHSFYQDFDFSVEDFKIKTSQEWLSSTQADVLVTGTSVPLNLEISLIAEAAKLGVVSMSFIDHWTNMAKRFRAINTLILPSWICVIDDRARQIAIDDGIPAEKILVTGNPYYEFIASWKPKIDRDGFLKSIRLPRDACYVLFAPEPLTTFGLEKKYGFTELDGIKMIYEVMRPILGKQVFIIIKGHPNQRHEVFTDFISRQGDSHLKYFQGLDINTCTYYAECVFGFFSNSLIEAKIMERLVMRPLMKMREGTIDLLQEMESPRFLSFYDNRSFTDAVCDLAKQFPLSTDVSGGTQSKA
jgi:hypothetical protein